MYKCKDVWYIYSKFLFPYSFSLFNSLSVTCFIEIEKKKTIKLSNVIIKWQ